MRRDKIPPGVRKALHNVSGDELAAMVDAAPIAPLEETPEMFFLQHGKQPYVGNYLVWWSKRGGYSPNVNDAQEFTREEAESEIKSSRNSHDFKMWSANYVRQHLSQVADIQDLGLNPQPQPK